MISELSSTPAPEDDHPDPSTAGLGSSASFACATGVPLARGVDTVDGSFIALIPIALPVQRMPMVMSRWRAVFELLLLVGFGWLGAFTVFVIYRQWPAEDTRWYFIWESMGVGATVMLTCVLMLRIAGHKAITIGWVFKDFHVNVGLGVAAFVVTVIVLIMFASFLIVIYPDILSQPSAAQQAIEGSFPRLSIPVIILMTLFVALWEEFVFRGFVLTRLYALFRRWWLAVLVGSAVFGMMHIYEGLLAVLLIFILGMIMGSLLVWRKSLLPSITFHLMHNLVMFLLLRSISTTWQ
ncbi:MAG: CPBP family intramembrane metalloprotease [Planctomycetota bacterium]|nr:MAG: CPBP family intramembrane metalloprotease [Planctomycetota bacterium]